VKPCTSFDNSIDSWNCAAGVLPNPTIKWERSKQLNVGADLSFFRDKLDFTIDYYNKLTDQLLIPGVPVSGILGTDAPGSAPPTINAGAVRNSGLEFAVGYRGEIIEGLKFNLDYNITTIKNEVTVVDNGTGILTGGEFGVGQPPAALMEVGFSQLDISTDTKPMESFNLRQKWMHIPAKLLWVQRRNPAISDLKI
jgi:outer membrane receptor protein involved in Fe transport